MSFSACVIVSLVFYGTYPFSQYGELNQKAATLIEWSESGDLLRFAVCPSTANDIVDVGLPVLGADATHLTSVFGGVLMALTILTVK